MARVTAGPEGLARVNGVGGAGSVLAAPRGLPAVSDPDSTFAGMKVTPGLLGEVVL